MAFWIILGEPAQHAYLARLLRARRKRPRRRTADERDDLASLHSKTVGAAGQGQRDVRQAFRL
jgi:hypothetical protein